MMKNFEKYADRFSLVIASGGIKKEYYDKYLSDLPIGFMSVKKLEEWLLAEYQEPIKLTHAEKVILENLDKRFTWIAKPKNAYAKAYQLKPVREENDWNGYSLPMSLIMFPNLFQFIRWEDKPLEIAWLLENCEVIEE